MKKLITLLLTATLIMTACSSDGDEPAAAASRTKASVSLIVTPNGVGDNGYNDCMVKGLFRFFEKTGVPVSLLQPDDSTEAVALYRNWLSEHATADSAVLVVGSSSFEQMVENIPPRLSGSGSRVLLLESTRSLEGASTLMIDRYGVSYWAGAMLHDCPVAIYAAAPGIPVLELAIQGFLDGHDSQPHTGRDSLAHIFYLSDAESGFANAETAYSLMTRHIEEYDEGFIFDYSVYPLLGGSGLGMVRAVNDVRATTGVLVGMDVDQQGLSSYIPFSVVTRVDNVLEGYLSDWRNGIVWPATQLVGLKDGVTDIVLSTTYTHPITSFVSEEIKDALKFKERYDLYKEEAFRKEAEYEKNYQ